MGAIGNTIIDLEEVNSTNLYAEQLLKKGAIEEGTVIIAKNQTAGRGQGENKWQSESGRNLTLTVILHPTFLLACQQFLINKVISLGVYDFLCDYVQEVCIKWPNDILISSKKVGGILIQHVVNNEMLETTIAGVGINVNQTHFDPHLSDAVSLVQVLGQELVLKDTLHQLTSSLEAKYAFLRQKEFDLLEYEYCNALLGYNEKRRYNIGKEMVDGIIRGVDEFGRLLVEISGKPVKAFNHKEIEYLL